MDENESKNLVKSLKEELALIDKELAAAKVDDLGPSIEDAAQEAGELDRLQPQVELLDKRKKEIVDTIQKIETGSYSK